MMEYENFKAQIEFDAEDNIFRGEVINTRDVIGFSGRSVEELQAAFRQAVERYLEWCRNRELPANDLYTGRVAVRISRDVHRSLAVAAQREGKPLNTWIAERLSEAVLGARP